MMQIVWAASSTRGVPPARAYLWRHRTRLRPLLSGLAWPPPLTQTSKYGAQLADFRSGSGQSMRRQFWQPSRSMRSRLLTTVTSSSWSGRSEWIISKFALKHKRKQLPHGKPAIESGVFGSKETIALHVSRSRNQIVEQSAGKGEGSHVRKANETKEKNLPSSAWRAIVSKHPKMWRRGQRVGRYVMSDV